MKIAALSGVLAGAGLCLIIPPLCEILGSARLSLVVNAYYEHPAVDAILGIIAIASSVLLGVWKARSI